MYSALLPNNPLGFPLCNSEYERIIVKQNPPKNSRKNNIYYHESFGALWKVAHTFSGILVARQAHSHTQGTSSLSSQMCPLGVHPGPVSIVTIFTWHLKYVCEA